MALTHRTLLSFLSLSLALCMMSFDTQAGALLSHLLKKHHYELGYGKDGRILVLKLVDSHSGRPIFTAYPEGSDTLKHIHHHDRLTRPQYLRLVKKLKRELKAQRPKSTGVRAAAAATEYRQGLGLGFSDTAGYIGGQSVCYHFTTEINGNQPRLSFSSSQTASTLAGQFNLGASVDLSFSFFKANNDFSYSSNYQNTANSGHLSYSAGSLYNANNVLVELSDYGKQAYDTGTFESQCGTDFISSIQVGMMVLGDLSWSSTTSEANQKIEDTLKTDFGFGHLTAAVTTASSVKNSQSEFQFNLTILGGGSDVSLEIENAYSSALDQRNKCLQDLSVDACAAFTATLEKAAISGIEKFDNKMKPENLPMDLGFLEPFPYGVKGFPQATTLVHFPAAKKVTGLVTPNYLKPYQPAIQNTMSLLSDLSILRNRAAYLYGKLYDPITKTNLFNPFPMRDIANNDLGSLASAFLGLRTSVLSALQSCLAAANDTVADDCKAVNDLRNNSTLGFISSRCVEVDVQQNHCSRTTFNNYLALQYVGLYSDPKGSFPLDFVYTGDIGTTWSALGDTKPPQGPALLGFVDSKYVYNGNAGVTDPFATVLAFGQTKVGNPMFPAPPQFLSPFYAFSKSSWAPQNGFAPLTVELAGACSANVPTPCPLNLGAYTPSSFNGTTGRMSLSIFPIQDLFAR